MFVYCQCACGRFIHYSSISLQRFAIATLSSTTLRFHSFHPPQHPTARVAHSLHHTNATLQGLQFLQSSAQAISSRMLLHSIPNPIVPFRSIATLAFSHRTFFSGMLYLPLRSVYPIGIVPPINIPFQYLRFLFLSK
jgi:hypothetical protein